MSELAPPTAEQRTCYVPVATPPTLAERMRTFADQMEQSPPTLSDLVRMRELLRMAADVIDARQAPVLRLAGQLNAALAHLQHFMGNPDGSDYEFCPHCGEGL